MLDSAISTAYRAGGSVLEEVDLAKNDQVEDRLLSDFSALPAPHPRPLPVRVTLDAPSARKGGTLLLTLPLTAMCPACSGEGFLGPFACEHCSGTGLVDVDVPVGLRIPENAPDGFRIRALLRHLGVKDVYLSVLLSVT